MRVSIKKVYILICISAIMYFIGLLFYPGYLPGQNSYIPFVIYVAFCLGAIIIGVFRLFQVKYTFDNIKLSFTEGYMREILQDYSPAQVALLLSPNSTNQKLITINALELVNKKACIIDTNNIIYPILNVDTSNLTLDEKYLYQQISSQKNAYFNEYYRDYILNELKRKGLLIVKKTNKLMYIFFIMYCLTMFMQIIMKFKKIKWVTNILMLSLFVIAIIFFSRLIISSIANILEIEYEVDKNFTYKGKIEVSKLYQIANFLKEFSIIKEREPDNVILWKRYLTYAMAFDLNDKYKSIHIENFEI